MIYTDKKSPRRLCEEVASYIDRKLARRPFNRFKPVQTSWWLVPSGEMPFYRFGKYCFTWDEKTMDYIDCGYYVEKGIDNSLRSVFNSPKGKKLLMNKKWQWPTFLEFCNNGSLEAAFDEVEKGFSGEDPVYIKISGGYVDDPSLYDPHSDKVIDDYFVFEKQRNSSALKIVEARRKSLQLKKLNKVKRLSDLVFELNSYDNEHFMWIRVFIFQRFQIANVDNNIILNVADSENIYESLLRPFEVVLD